MKDLLGDSFSAEQCANYKQLDVGKMKDLLEDSFKAVTVCITASLLLAILLKRQQQLYLQENFESSLAVFHHWP